MKLINAIVLVVVVACFVGSAEAGSVTISEGGRTASAEWTLDTTADTLTIVLENLTAEPSAADDLLTGFGFTLSPGANPSLDEATADAITISSLGIVTDVGTVDLLDIGGSATWSLVYVGGGYELRFNPDAAYSIIGPPESDGTYSSANGSITGNTGHNPFVDGVATFVLGVEGDPSLSGQPYFLFGTDFGVTVVPLPPSAVMGLLLLGGLGLTRRLRKRGIR